VCVHDRAFLIYKQMDQFSFPQVDADGIDTTNWNRWVSCFYEVGCRRGRIFSRPSINPVYLNQAQASFLKLQQSRVLERARVKCGTRTPFLDHLRKLEDELSAAIALIEKH
jgi:hypothetical protein